MSAGGLTPSLFEAELPPAVRPSRWGSRALVGVFAAVLFGLVGLPVLALLLRAGAAGPAALWAAITEPTALDALWRSLWTAALTTAIQAVAGTAVAWALVRWEFPGRRLLLVLVDLPLAIPTLVAGILIVALFGPTSPLGSALSAAGMPIAYAWPGVVLALLFVTLPLPVRAVEPVLAELDPAEEEAAYTLGATRFTTFFRVLLPPLLPAIGAGAVQTFARAVAEFGSIAAVSGNVPFQTLTAPVYVLGEVEGGNLDGAVGVSVLLLGLALALQPLSRALAARAGASRG